MTNTSAVNPSEVGWQFVPQYYTFVNKQPNRLHCFYTKASTFIHGTEGEDGKPCYGQQEIHAKITSIGFQDCKVFIHSVDAQSSANGGIIIQVIGEMSNQGDPWRKFVQTFFLAEQPNGYFVLNDIFRFLKEETVEDEPIDDSEPPVTDAPVMKEPVAAPAPIIPAPAPPVPELEPSPSPSPSPSPPPPVVQEEPEIPVPEPASEKTNGFHEKPSEPTPVAEPEAVPQDTPEPPATVSPPSYSPPAPAPQQLAPSPAPPAQQQQPHAPTPAAPAPAPSAPAAPKTWANLAAAGRNKWGSAVAQEARGVSEAPVVTSSPAPTSTPQSPAPRQQNQQHPLLAAANNVTTAQCFVKGVIEPVSDAALRNTLTQRFGPLKEIEIVRSKACAFLEFTQLDAARRAIIASIPVTAGGEGGIRVTDGAADTGVRITVETRKERGDRPPPRGPPMNGDRGRGGFRGGRGGPGGARGRGAPPPQK
ncbi:hypothetical protein PHLCEN_2v13542 [Hermanssonia centrifuga]|uniref:G3BP-like protein n=1 Tax=Hermanssonia centrifuga TaxID=98765 RepID=A0A2R6NE11_9APHY|nr:hypothetical protein PHLCEN_2v13542 [Hermanssonia centrifuga]